MADCYIVRRGGTGGGENNDLGFSIGYAGVVPPIEDVFCGGEIVSITEE